MGLLIFPAQPSVGGLQAWSRDLAIAIRGGGAVLVSPGAIREHRRLGSVNICVS